MDYKTYKDWFKDIVWLKDKVILPNGQTVSKNSFIKEEGFNIDGFNSFLFKTYNTLYPVKKDGRRYKK